MATNNSQQRLAYSVNQPLTAIFNPPIISNRVPTTKDKQPLGTLWVVKLTNSSYIITSVVNNLANWQLVSAAAGALSQITAEDSSVATPVAGNIIIEGDGNVDTTAAGDTLTISLVPSPTFAGTVTANAITVGDLTVTGDFGINSTAQIDFTSSDAAANAILLSATAGGVQILAAGNPILLSTTNQAINLVSGTGAINVGADAAAKTITIGNVTGATGVVINSGTNGVAVASTGAGDITLNSSDTLLLDSAGVLELNSSAGAISIGNDAVAQAINIGTGAAARVITIGNVTGATSLTLRSGTGNFAINPVATATITIGNTAQSGQISVGDSTAALTVDLMNGVNTGTQTLNIANAATAANSSVQILSGAGSAGTSSLLMANNPRVNTVDIANVAPAAARITTIAGGNSAQNDAVNIMAGAPSAGNQSVNIMSGVATGGTQQVNIATGNSAKTVHVADGAAANTVIIGSTTASAATTLQAGSGATGLKLSAGGNVQMVPSTASVASPTSSVTNNNRVASITFTGFTTASSGAQTFTVTNSAVLATSAIFCTVTHVKNTNANVRLTLEDVEIAAAGGSFLVKVTNNGADALDGDVIINWWILS